MIGNKKHICLNLISDPNWHGGNIYIYNIVHAFSKLPADERNRIHLSIAARKASDVPDEIRGKVDRIFTDTFLYLALFKVIKMLNGLLPGFLVKMMNTRAIDFYYPGFYTISKLPFRWAGWIPDFQHRYLPHMFSKEECQSRDHRYTLMGRNAPRIAFSSQTALDDFNKFYPGFEDKPYLLRFVSNADEAWLKDDPLLYQQKYKLPDSFFIVCNQFWKHKDHHTILDALAILKKENILPHVVCTGATEDVRNPDYYPSLLKKIKDLGLESQVSVLGFIPRKDQIQLIRRSVGIIQPSLFEGWSTVVEDGRAFGKTILASDFPVHLEQNPPGTIFFRQQDAKQLAGLIKVHIPQLQSGPDKQREEAAFKTNFEAMRNFGREVIALSEVV